MTRPKIIIQFNEANFDLIEKYSKKYKLKNFNKILNFSSKINTTSEDKYENLEPWIQWYSFYTQKSFEEHGVFHLGDAEKRNHSTFLDNLNRIGIFGSMNIPKLSNAEIFIPDAWSEIKPDSTFSSKSVHSAVAQIVNDNAKLKISPKSIIGLFLLVGLPIKMSNLKIIIQSIKSIIKKSRAELAAVFDYFFFNYSLKRIIKKKLNFSLIFLNGLAHVQHHHLLDSEFVNAKNPTWYSKDIDHLKNTLKIYDELFGNLIDKSFNDFNIWIITGLSQSPCEKPIFYWRFDDHHKVLNNFLDFSFRVYPRMTRDFEIEYINKENKNKLLDFINNSVVLDQDGEHKAFGKVDQTAENRIFCSFVYDGNSIDSCLQWQNIKITLEDHINFIAIKNGQHNSKGWAYNNGKQEKINAIPIWKLSKYI